MDTYVRFIVSSAFRSHKRAFFELKGIRLLGYPRRYYVLLERAAMLRYTYIAHLVMINHKLNISYNQHRRP